MEFKKEAPEAESVEHEENHVATSSRSLLIDDPLALRDFLMKL